MKIFISACTALVLCIALVFMAQSYIIRSASSLSRMTASLPETLTVDENAPDSIIGSIDSSIEYWRSRRPVLCTAISHKEFDEIENLLIALLAAARSNDSGNYAVNAAELKERLEKLSMSEKLSLDNIL